MSSLQRGASEGTPSHESFELLFRFGSCAWAGQLLKWKCVGAIMCCRMEMFLGTMTHINGGTTFLFYFLLPLLYCCCHKDLPGHGAIMMCLKMITLSFSNLMVLETS
uniref:Uncharacterized protein n=1 Tax=Aegilops tauschii subsp. strangulata TaxID=200361 RepID=A0A453AWI8_AEGTS